MKASILRSTTRGADKPSDETKNRVTEISSSNLFPKRDWSIFIEHWMDVSWSIYFSKSIDIGFGQRLCTHVITMCVLLYAQLSLTQMARWGVHILFVVISAKSRRQKFFFSFHMSYQDESQTGFLKKAKWSLSTCMAQIGDWLKLKQRQRPILYSYNINNNFRVLETATLIFFSALQILKNPRLWQINSVFLILLVHSILPNIPHWASLSFFLCIILSLFLIWKHSKPDMINNIFIMFIFSSSKLLAILLF